MSNQVVPARGMRDFLPKEKAKRESVINIIRGVYRSFGYTEIETPVMEDIDRLTQSEGGENLTMLFKVLKRGLDPKIPLLPNDAVDLGLRYDLTLPLARYYASNSSALPNVFRATQIAPVWRAERPQKGRFRQFTQCDIDIVGMADERAEVELISVTTLALQALGITGTTVRINDRRLLAALLEVSGFAPALHSSVLIVVDKQDKIGLAGVKDELINKFPDHESAINALLVILAAVGEKTALNAFDVESIISVLPEKMHNDALDTVRKIIAEVQHAVPSARLRFDPTLVRGMGYYTGPIFEVEAPNSSSSIAGGGRYDGMVGKFSGRPVPACGFSLGFERLVDLVSDDVLVQARRIVLFYDTDEAPGTVFLAQRSLIAEGYEVVAQARPKQLGKAIDAAREQGIGFFASLEKGATSVAADAIKSTEPK